MTLQNMCETVGGRREPVRRNRNAQWKPKRLVYVSWNTAEPSRLLAIRLLNCETSERH